VPEKSVAAAPTDQTPIIKTANKLSKTRDLFISNLLL